MQEVRAGVKCLHHLQEGPRGLSGHTLTLIRDPLCTWDTLNISYYVLLGGQEDGENITAAQALKFGRKVGIGNTLSHHFSRSQMICSLWL